VDVGLPVRLSDELVLCARDEARAADRSMTAQIEHWAKLGRAVESVLRHGDVRAIKARVSRPPARSGRRAVRAALAQAIDGDSSAARAKIGATGQPLYGTDPRWPGLVVRIDADGTRTPGRFDQRRFVPDDGATRRR
jgi:hypothetical protein